MGGVWHWIMSDLALDRLWCYPVDPSYQVADSVTRADVIDLVYRWLTYRRCFTNGSTPGFPYPQTAQEQKAKTSLEGLHRTTPKQQRRQILLHQHLRMDLLSLDC